MFSSRIILKMKKSEFKVLFCLVFSYLMVTTFTLADVSNPELSNFLLPGDILPESYDLVIYTNLNENVFAFSGSVLVKVRCIIQTNQIILHAKDLTIMEKQVTVRLDEHNPIEIQSHQYDKKVDFYIINLKTFLQPETFYFLYIPFEAALGVGAFGYYRSSYTDAAGNERWIALTLFDPISARRAFPCWDDLPYKARFSISLAHDENLIALSNSMELANREKVEELPGWVMTKFNKSPPLPPSNVAFVIFDFESVVVTLPPRNIQLRIWARTELLYQAELASNTLSEALPFNEQLFDLQYPLPKLDLIALPNYSVGSVSCLGLSMFKETGILFDPNSNGEYNRRNIVSEECAMVNQQLFNNIVTGREWEGLWLGTGLVYYFQIPVVDGLLPNWAYGFHTFADQFITVLNADSSKTAHALQVVIESPDMIDQLYDTITFNKGPYVLRMLSLIVGNDLFQLGVNNYLKQYQFKKADQFDLWKMLTDVTNVDIEGLMNPWTLKAGFPYLFVDIDYSKQTVTVSQERFLFDEKTEEEATERENYCWPVALTFTTSVNPNFKDLTINQWLSCDGPVTFPLEIADTHWVIFNLSLLVPCRINYSEKNWDYILKTLADKNRFQEIDVRNRMQIVDDLFAFAAAEILDYGFVFDAIMYLQYEIDYLPWGVAMRSLADIRSFFRRTDLYERFQACVRLMLEPVYARLGKFGELPKDYYQGGYKYQLTFWSCEYGVDSCQKSCLETLRTWAAVPNPDEFNPIEIDIRGFVYCQALRICDEDDWDFLWQRYVNARGPLDKDIILTTLGCTRLTNKLQQLLDWSIDPNVFKPEQSPEVFLQVVDSASYQMSTDFFINRFQDIYKYLSGNPDLLGKYLPLLYSLIRTQQELLRLNNFVDTIRPQLVGTEKSLNEAINFANNVLRWINKYEPIFAKIFQDHLPEGT